MLSPRAKLLAGRVAKSIHRDDYRSAAQEVSDECKLGLKIEDDSPAKSLPVLQHYFHYLLEAGGNLEAASLLWSPNQFSGEPESVKQLWKLWDETSLGLVMGAGSMGKSFSIGARLLLEYARDPEYTTIRVLGPSKDHLEQNLFSHLVSLHSQAKLPMPGQVGQLFIGLSRRNQTSAIKGVIIPIGKTKKAGRLQGAKRKPRKVKHPIFGELSRMFIFIDEFENLPGGIWSDIDNILSNVQEEGAPGGFKLFGAYNPTNQTDEVGKRAEPPFGWENFHVDTHFRWKSVRGWEVLRLDGEKSENVVQNKVVYPGLQTRSGLEMIARNAGGREAAGYYSMGRGAYPPQGISLTIVPPGMIPKSRGEFIYQNDPFPVGSCDLALEGGAAAVYTLGKLGMATGMKLAPSLDFPTGQIIMFKDEKGRSQPRWGLQADQQFPLPKGETVSMTNRNIELSKKAGVRPKRYACDRTGAGAGTADLIKNQWGTEIHDVNYSDGPSTTKIMEEDSQTCAEEFDRICSELWYALRKWMEFGYLLLNPNLDLTKLTPQLTNRLCKTAGKKSKVEAKRDYISRGHESPDEADSLTLFVHAARKGEGLILSMRSGGGASPTADDDDSDWRYPGGTRVDASNRTESLEENVG